MRSLRRPSNYWDPPSWAPDASHPEWLRRSLVPVHLVCGPPAAGKTTFVRQRAGADELIIDLDEIRSKLSGNALHADFGRLIGPALAERNRILAPLAEPSQWQAAWLIIGEPIPAARQWWRNALGPGTTYVLATPPAQCHQRIDADPSRRAVASEHKAAVDEWWRRYRRTVGDNTTGGLATETRPNLEGRSPEGADYHRLYNLRRWRRRSRYQLQQQPLCQACAALGVVEPAAVADHIEPHNGDLRSFLLGELQSLCGAHHSGAKQSSERAGVSFSSEIGPDGLPIDPRHPAYR